MKNQEKIINYERLSTLFTKLLNYVIELKENDCREDKELFLKNIIGFTDKEIKLFLLDIDFLGNEE